MGKDTHIEWCHHTFNPWRGCTKVSPGCTNCYAEALSHRNPGVLGIWGDGGTRVVASEPYWAQPLAWARAAEKAGERRRVFCASLADVFEGRPELAEPRERLFATIQATPGLDWLLLTKRPEAVSALAAEALGWRVAHHGLPPNVWIGASVEDQARADERIPHLLKTPAARRFLSVEPLLGPVNIASYLCDFELGRGKGKGNLHWVIVGGESGPKARPMHPDWARSIRDQCVASGTSYFFKQWGEWAPAGSQGRHCFNPGASVHDLVTADRVGKKAAGRTLDGCTWDQFPPPLVVAS